MQDLPDLLDFTALCAPISRKQPTGKDLRQHTTLLPTYHQIKDARTTARTLERQQIQGNETSTKADWHTVYQLAVKNLSTQSKDLEIAVWLTEALLREAGFLGLSRGFKLIRLLCEKFWDKQLYPLPDEEGVLSRVAALTGLNGEEVEGALIMPIALVPLTEANTLGPYALWQYHQALEVMKVVDPEKRAQRLAAGAVSLAMIETALAESSMEFLHKQRQALLTSIEEYTLLIALLEKKCGHNAPPCSRILSQLHACIDCLNCIQQADPPLVAQENSHAALITGSAPDVNTPLPANPIEDNSSREQVLKTLLQAAAFFRITEPHSPLPYVLERAVRWAKTPLPMLLKELIQDESARGQVGHLTGIGFDT